MPQIPLRKILLLVVFISVVLAVPLYIIYYFASTHVVRVTAHNITSYSVAETGNKNAGKSYTASPESIRLKKNTAYTITYTAAEGYADGSRAIDATTSAVTLRPDYSAAKLDALLDDEIDAINKVISQSGTTIDTLYAINRGQLLKNGAWYFTTLSYTYSGSSNYGSRDTLVIGLQKKDGKWGVKLSPNIVFTTIQYPLVERDFINAANNYHLTHVTPTEE